MIDDAVYGPPRPRATLMGEFGKLDIFIDHRSEAFRRWEHKERIRLAFGDAEADALPD